MAGDSPNPPPRGPSQGQILKEFAPTLLEILPIGWRLCPGNYLALSPEGVPGAYLVGDLWRLAAALAAGLYVEGISWEISGV